jgi:hypothetical protein
MGEAARAWAVERFDWAALARRAGEILGEGAPPRGRRPGRGVTA